MSKQYSNILAPYSIDSIDSGIPSNRIFVPLKKAIFIYKAHKIKGSSPVSEGETPQKARFSQDHPPRNYPFFFILLYLQTLSKDCTYDAQLCKYVASTERRSMKRHKNVESAADYTTFCPRVKRNTKPQKSLQQFPLISPLLAVILPTEQSQWQSRSGGSEQPTDHLGRMLGM